MDSSQHRVRTHRERLRAQGLRPLQIWVPDVRAPELAAAAHEQSLAIAMSAHEENDQAFVDAVSSDRDDSDEARGGTGDFTLPRRVVTTPESHARSYSFTTIVSTLPPPSRCAP